jgi:hypothetical protein
MPPAAQAILDRLPILDLDVRSACVENASLIGYPFLFDVITDRQEAGRRTAVYRDSARADGRD